MTVYDISSRVLYFRGQQEEVTENENYPGQDKANHMTGAVESTRE